MRVLFALWVVSFASMVSDLASASSQDVNTPVASGILKARGKERVDVIGSGALTDRDFEKCGHDCLYTKANENLAVQIEYNQAVISKLKDPTYDREKKVQLLGRFCDGISPSGDGVATDDDSLESCIQRYIKLNEFWLLKVRAAVRHHDEQVSLLECTDRDSGGRCLRQEKSPLMAMRGSSGGSLENRKAQTPTIAKASDLARWAAQLAEEQSKMGDSQDWMNGLFFDDKMRGGARFRPKEEDFPKFKCIEKDNSTDPPSCKREIAEMANGKHVIDKVAFERANKEWLALQADLATQRDQLKEQLKESGNTRPKSISENTKAMAEEFKSPPKPGSQVSAQHEIFNEVQGQLVDAINDHVQSKKKTPFNSTTSQLTFSGASSGDATVTKKVPLASDYDGESEVKARYSQDTGDSQGQRTSRFFLKPDVGRDPVFGEKDREFVPASSHAPGDATDDGRAGKGQSDKTKNGVTVRSFKQKAAPSKTSSSGAQSTEQANELMNNFRPL